MDYAIYLEIKCFASRSLIKDVSIFDDNFCVRVELQYNFLIDHTICNLHGNFTGSRSKCVTKA